jgi:hypothetical protein
VSNRSIYPLALRSNCSLQPIIIGIKKNAEIEGDFGHNGITSKDMANRRLRTDSARRIGLSADSNGVLTVVWGESALC